MLKGENITPYELCVYDKSGHIRNYRQRPRNIFKLFYSSKGTRGTGIGLFITRKVIHKHGGSISVDTELGKGARFTLTLPRNLPENK